MIRLLQLAVFLCLISCNHSESKELEKDKESPELLLPETITTPEKKEKFVKYIVNPEKEDLYLYWKDDNGNILSNFTNLKNFVETQNKELLFAMNGGMYMTNGKPLGLYVEDGKTVTPLNTKKGSSNFYIQPNGIFFVDKNNISGIITTNLFNSNNIRFATQSGPMLIINGKINPKFSKNNGNQNIRNGVGITRSHQVVFVISNEPVSFYDFAEYFLSLDCSDALYLDGAISNIYLKDHNRYNSWDNFGVIIGVTKK